MVVTIPQRPRMAAPSAIDILTLEYLIRALTTLQSNVVAIARPRPPMQYVALLPGGALALLLACAPLPAATEGLLLALASTCLIASANDTANGWLDGAFDRRYQVNKSCAPAAGQITAAAAFAPRDLGPTRLADHVRSAAGLAVLADIVELRKSLSDSPRSSGPSVNTGLTG